MTNKEYMANKTNEIRNSSMIFKFEQWRDKLQRNFEWLIGRF